MAIEDLPKTPCMVGKYANFQALSTRNRSVTVCFLSQSAENDIRNDPLLGFHRDTTQVITYIFLNQANKNKFATESLFGVVQVWGEGPCGRGFSMR